MGTVLDTPFPPGHTPPCSATATIALYPVAATSAEVNIPMPGILDGVRVIEWAIFHAGPGAGTLLAALGAEVIKLEEPSRGDPARYMHDVLGAPNLSPDGESYFFELFNRGKKSVTVNLREEEGRDIVYKLVEKADVFLTSFRPQSRERAGLDYESARKINPRIIYASLNAFGPKGPDKDRPGFDSDGMARAGMFYAMRDPKREPYVVRGPGDEMGSISTAFGVVGALYNRERTGKGQQVHTSILGGAMWVNATTLGLRLLTGYDVPPALRIRPISPLDNQYQAKDGKWFNLASNLWWPQFCRAIGHPELEHDPRYKDAESRRKNAEFMVRFLDGVFATRTRDQWLETFGQHDIACSPCNPQADVASDPQPRANDYVVEYDHPRLGRVTNLGFCIGFEDTPADFTVPGPALGEHTEEMLSRLLGYGTDDYRRLKESGIV